MIQYDQDQSKWACKINMTLEKYQVTAHAREFLTRIKTRLGVIAVAGKYRTGKSFLLNRVILN